MPGILQARILERIAFSSPGNLPNPGMEPGSPALHQVLSHLSHQTVKQRVHGYGAELDMLGHHLTYAHLCSNMIISVEQITEVNYESEDRHTANFEGSC